MKTLVVVEAPGKVAKIQKFLGSDYIVVPTAGHIMDLDKDKSAIDVKNGFEPKFIISPEKKEIVSKLKEAYKKCDDIIIFSDLDREGTGIGYTVCKLLNINPKTVKRAVTDEITEKAVKKAIANPGKLDLDMVNAFLCRRILDRLVGFDLSPLLWQIQQKLSAGRVQSAALRLIVEIEKEHKSFSAEADYKTTAVFEFKDAKNKVHTFKAVLNKRFKKKEDAIEFLKQCLGKDFTVKTIQTKEGKRNPSPPFVTSTLQQEANRKLGFSVDRTMSTAQSLYQSGHISYHRTDSPMLSEEAETAIHAQIKNKFGDRYLSPKKYSAKASSQEAHEACRPTHFENETIQANSDEERLYSLIYNRTLASQMSPAVFDKTTAVIGHKDLKEDFIATGEVLKFDGFLRLYKEDTDDDQENQEEDDNKSLPKMEKGDILKYNQIDSYQVFTKPSARFTEASLVKKLEELQIGRPSTFASIISTVTNRGYVEKKNTPAIKRDVVNLQLINNKIDETIQTENFGAEKNKLFPTDIGIVVTDYLFKHFPEILDYKFTANVETDFDNVAQGKKEWRKMLEEFYTPFSEKVQTVKTNKEKVGGRNLGTEPGTNKSIIARIARFGPVIQVGEAKGDTRFVKMPEDKSIDSITLEEALELLKWPKNLGEYKKMPVEANTGKFGPYVKYNSKFYSISIPPEKITLVEAIEIIKEKDAGGGTSGNVKKFGDISVINGKYGPYLSRKGKNFKIPADIDYEKITEAQCKEIIGEGKKKPVNKKSFKKNKK